MKVFLILLLILFIPIIVACNNDNNNIEEIHEEMDMRGKFRYARGVDFDLLLFIDGGWYLSRDFVRASYLATQDNSFYTELRFVLHPDEVSDPDGTLNIPNTVIVAFPREDSVERVLTALNWEVVSAEIDLDKYGLSYPITAEDLVRNYESMNRLIRYEDRSFQFVLSTFAGGVHDTRIEFELDRIFEWRSGNDASNAPNADKVLNILEQLSLPEDDGWRLLRAAGSVDAFEAVVDLMLEEGLSSDDALRRVARGR